MINDRLRNESARDCGDGAHEAVGAVVSRRLSLALSARF
jgi:hypothetical protein